MSEVSDLIDAGKRHYVTIKNKDGKILLKLSLLWTVLIIIAAPQLLLVTLIALALDLIAVEYDGQELQTD